LARQHRKQVRNLVTQLTAINNSVDSTFLDQKFGSLKALG
jgi:hypothetical protein